MKLFLLSFLILNSIFSQATERMDIHIHDIVIGKLESAIGNLNSNDKNKLPIILRLGDLYSDRARLRFLSEVEKNCDNCFQSKEDRFLAIKYFIKALPFTDYATQAKIHLQMAHLYNLNNDTNSARKSLNKIITGGKKFGSVNLSIAYDEMGEIEFKNANFKKAKYYFNKSFANPKLPKRGFTLYRLAWCELNLGETEKAISSMNTLLSSKKLLDLGQDSKTRGVNSFQEDASRDFATFLARKPITEKSVNKLLKLSPNTVSTSNLFYLATEAERLGQKNSAIMVWTHYLAKGEISYIEQLEIKIRMAQLQFDLNQIDHSLKSYSEAIQIWKLKGCEEQPLCSEIKSRLRNFVISWTKIKKQQPSHEMLLAYEIYTKVFSDDPEMMIWQGEIARQQNNWKLAFESYLAAAKLMAKDNNSHEKLESVLLLAIESSEKFNTIEARTNAYDNYLELSKLKSREFDVLYQIAHLKYENKSYAQAAVEFESLALNQKLIGKELGLQSADLALDSYVLSGQTENIEKTALEFAQFYPSRRLEYIKIARTSVLNKTVLTVNHPNASESENIGAIKKLQSVSLAGANDKEKRAIYKNQLILYVRLKDLEGIKKYANLLLNTKGISSTDKDLALNNLIWVAESQLNFSLAYQLSKTQLNNKAKNKNLRFLLRMAMLAELSKKDPTPYYLKFIDESRSVSQANQIRLQLIRKTGLTWNNLKKFESKLKRTPHLYSEISLEIYSKKPSKSEALNVLKHRSVKNTVFGRALKRQLDMNEFEMVYKKISAHHLNKRSDKRLQSSIKNRLELLSQLETISKDSIKSKDWTMQVLTLNALSNKYDNFYKELIALPPPRGLSKKEKLQYKELLKANALRYSKLSESYSKKSNELLSSYDVSKSLKNDIENSRPLIRNLLKKEAKLLAKYVDNKDSKTNFIQLANYHPDNNLNEKSKKLISKVKSDPFNNNLLEELKEVEEKRGSEPMVAFLEGRLTELRN